MTIHVVPVVEGVGDCLASYNCDAPRIEVIEPSNLDAALVSGSVLARLDQDRLFESLVVHEWAHAMLDAASPRPVHDLGDQEYVAYAMQLQSLPEAERRVWLDAPPGSENPGPREVNAIIAAADPLRFATRAWRCFAANDHGCASIRDVIAGDLTFALGRF